jgi:enterochelin esterase-like enzyme
MKAAAAAIFFLGLFACRDIREVTVAPPVRSHQDAGLRPVTDASTQGHADAQRSDVADGSVPDADAQTLDAGVSNCDFLPAANTERLSPHAGWSVQDLNRLLNCVQSDPASAPAVLDAFWSVHLERGGAAIWDSDEAVLLYRGDASGLSVSGSFDQWPRAQGRLLVSVANTDLHFVRVGLKRSGRYQYKWLKEGTGSTSAWVTDAQNRWVTWDGFNQHDVGDFNNEIIGPEHVYDKSLLYRFEQDGRDIFIQLPLSYLRGETVEAALYLNDGNEYLTRAGLQEVVDETIASGRAISVLVVYVALADQNERLTEYTYGPSNQGDAYVARLAGQYVPAVENLVGLSLLNGARGIGGASLGGLISFHAAWRHNDVFQLIGAQSASLWFEQNEMIERFRQGPNINASIYIDSGSPADNSEATRLMVSVLEQRNYPHHHFEQANASHDWAFWRDRFDELLDYLY